MSSVCKGCIHIYDSKQQDDKFYCDAIGDYVHENDHRCAKYKSVAMSALLFGAMLSGISDYMGEIKKDETD